jgi:hypothetical protein
MREGIGLCVSGVHWETRYSASLKVVVRPNVVGLVSDLQQAETQELAVHGVVALTGSILKTLAILNCHHASGVIDQLRSMKESCRQGDGCTRGTKHLSEKIMGQ